MKKLVIILISVFMFMCTSVYAKDITLQFGWDANTEADMAGYALFMKKSGQEYNYDNPIDPTCTIVDGGCYINSVDKVNEYSTTIPAPDNQISTWNFVARARDVNNNWSEDSEEVTAIFDLRVPSSPSIYSAVYNDTTQTIDFSFGQVNPELVSRWKLYISSTPSGPYTQVGTDILNDGTTNTASWYVSSDGNYYFVLVAFRDGHDDLSTDGKLLTSIDSSFSSNSNEILAQVQIHPGQVHNFKVKLRVYQ